VGKKYGAAYGCVRAGGFAGVCVCACRWILSLSEWHRPATGGQVTQERRTCGTAYGGCKARAWRETGKRWTRCLGSPAFVRARSGWARVPVLGRRAVRRGARCCCSTGLARTETRGGWGGSCVERVWAVERARGRAPSDRHAARVACLHRTGQSALVVGGVPGPIGHSGPALSRSAGQVNSGRLTGETTRAYQRESPSDDEDGFDLLEHVAPHRVALGDTQQEGAKTY
jgi:hypothetical protein